MIHAIFNRVRKYDCFVVSLVLFPTYFLIVLSFGFLQSLSETMFSSPDSRTYRDVSDWILGIKNTNSTIIRPFFYPLMLNLSRSFASIYGIWCYQFLLWILSGVLLYQSIKTVTNNIVLSVGGLIIFASNLTLLLLTLHALTEITVTFLIIILIIIVINKQKYKNDHYWLLVIFVVSLLTVTKPVYMGLLYAILIYRIPVFIMDIKKRIHKLRLLSYIALVLCPVLVQLSIMKVKHNEFTISKIGAITVQRYYFARVYGEVNNMSVRQARKHTISFDQNEILEFLLANYKESIRTYIRQIETNIRWPGSNFINFPTPHTYLSKYMKLINNMYFYIHVLMILPLIIVLIALFVKKKHLELETILHLLFPLGLIFATSGITFWQGDRILLPSLPLWIVLYSVIVSRSFHLIIENHLTKRST